VSTPDENRSHNVSCWTRLSQVRAASVESAGVVLVYRSPGGEVYRTSTGRALLRRLQRGFSRDLRYQGLFAPPVANIISSLLTMPRCAVLVFIMAKILFW
jgi:hypothetical protein